MCTRSGVGKLLDLLEAAKSSLWPVLIRPTRKCQKRKNYSMTCKNTLNSNFGVRKESVFGTQPHPLAYVLSVLLSRYVAELSSYERTHSSQSLKCLLSGSL